MDIYLFFTPHPERLRGHCKWKHGTTGKGPGDQARPPHCQTTVSQARTKSTRAPRLRRPPGPPYPSQGPRCLIAPFWVLARENRKQNRWPMLAWATLGGSPSRVYIEKVYRRPLSTFRSGGEQTFARAPAVSLKGCLIAPLIPSPSSVR